MPHRRAGDFHGHHQHISGQRPPPPHSRERHGRPGGRPRGTLITAFGGIAGGFSAPTLALNAFGHSVAAGNWSTIRHLRLAPEVGSFAGDGRADIYGFGETAVAMSLGQADRTLSLPVVALSGDFGFAPAGGSWDVRAPVAGLRTGTSG
jgi:hypothetical protein